MLLSPVPSDAVPARRIPALPVKAAGGSRPAALGSVLLSFSAEVRRALAGPFICSIVEFSRTCTLGARQSFLFVIMMYLRLRLCGAGREAKRACRWKKRFREQPAAPNAERAQMNGVYCMQIPLESPFSALTRKKAFRYH